MGYRLQRTSLAVTISTVLFQCYFYIKIWMLKCRRWNLCSIAATRATPSLYGNTIDNNDTLTYILSFSLSPPPHSLSLPSLFQRMNARVNRLFCAFVYFYAYYYTHSILCSLTTTTSSHFCWTHPPRALTIANGVWKYEFEHAQPSLLNDDRSYFQIRVWVR